MIRIIPSFCFLFFCLPAFAGGPQLKGHPYHSRAAITWEATNQLPCSLMVYKVLPKQFSKEIVSKMLEIASFQPVTMQLSEDKKTMSWLCDIPRQQRSLDISPAYGCINYSIGHNDTNAAIGVPSEKEVQSLAMVYLNLLGADTNQIAEKPRPRIVKTRQWYDKNGNLRLDDVPMRGIMLSRQVDGVRFCSAGGRGGFLIEFGSNAKVENLHLVWRNLQPYKRYRTANSNEIMAMIREGKAVVPGQEANLRDLPKATKLTITGMTPLYWGEPGDVPQDFTYPYAELDVTADVGGTNKICFSMDCPILSKDVVK